MNYRILHTWAQEELREFQIEAENFKEAEEKFRKLREQDDFYDLDKAALGDVCKDGFEISNGREQTEYIEV